MNVAYCSTDLINTVCSRDALSLVDHCINRGRSDRYADELYVMNDVLCVIYDV